ncbi:unnamed protein product, partial [Mesorhabditis belari]|uniref:Uncharacterized protein n=1 Tax=Mesorhabditis belari TaxID=2138241 RepID=A0AAF3EXW7_9BILA
MFCSSAFFVCKRHIVDGAKEMQEKKVKAFRDRDITQRPPCESANLQASRHPEMREILRAERCLEVTPLARRLGFRQKTFHDLEVSAKDG